MIYICTEMNSSSCWIESLIREDKKKKKRKTHAYPILLSQLAVKENKWKAWLDMHLETEHR